MLSFPQALISQARERVPQLLSPRVTISGNALTDTPNRVPPLPNLVKLANEISHHRSPGCELETPVPHIPPTVFTVMAPCE